MYLNGNNSTASCNAIYFNSFEVEHIPKEIKKFIENKNIITNIYRIKEHDSIKSGYCCIGFIDLLIIKGRSLLDDANLSSTNNYEKNNEIILKYFQ